MVARWVLDLLYRVDWMPARGVAPARIRNLPVQKTKIAVSIPMMNRAPDDDLQLLFAEDPFLRALAQQLVVSDADEVVQQTWLQALQQSRADIEQPRSWLTRIARNVAALVANKRSSSHAAGTSA